MPADYEKVPSKSVHVWLTKHCRRISRNALGVFVFTLVVLLLLWHIFPHSHVDSLEAEAIISTYRVRAPDRDRIMRSTTAVIKSRYVWSRLPNGELPSFMIAYTCNDHTSCGSSTTLSDRLSGLVTAFYTALVIPNTAFLSDWTYPVRLEWYFRNEPAGLSIPITQGHDILSRITQANQSHLVVWDALTHDPSNILSIFDPTKQWPAVRVVSILTGHASWPSLLQNPNLRHQTGGYNLSPLSRSELFAVAHQLLFARPTDWFRDLLEPYKDLIGPPYLNPQVPTPLPRGIANPNHRPNLEHTLRIGIEIVPLKDETPSHLRRRATCLAEMVAKACAGVVIVGGRCGVFVASADQEVIKTIKDEVKILAPKAKIYTTERLPAVHLTDLMTELPSQVGDWNEDQIRGLYARDFLDWSILSRMDYLVVSGGEWGILAETAAWVSGGKLERMDESCAIEVYEGW